MGTPAGNVDQTQLGSGRLLLGAVGAVEPTDCTTAWDAGWVEIGFTKDGVQEKLTQTIVDAIVEEVLDPIKGITSSRKASVMFSAAQMTALNYKRAMNGGTIATAGATTKVTPLKIGGELYVAVGWESTPGDERRVWRRCLNTSALTIPRRTKTADLAVLNIEFTAYGVTGQDPFFALFDAATRAA
jgi:hypothetical protein